MGQSKAMVTHADGAVTDSSGPSTFESQPKASTAAVTHKDLATAPDGASVFESQPKETSAMVSHTSKVDHGSEPSVFESKPSESKAAAGANRKDVDDDDYEYYTDSD